MWWKRTPGVTGTSMARVKRDVGMAEDRVDAESPGFVGGDVVSHFIGGPAVGAGCGGEAGLIGRVVRNLGLVEISAAVVAVPQHLELLVMFDEEAIGGDVVAIDDEAVVAEVAGPADAGAVIGSPDPGVVDDGVVGIDAEVNLGAAHACSADTEEDVVEEDGILRVRCMACLAVRFRARAGRLLRTGIDEESGDVDAVNVGGGDGGCAVGGLYRREAKTEDDGVGVRDVNRLRQVIVSGSEEQILALRQLGVDGGGGVFVRSSDVELAEWNGAARVLSRRAR